MFVFGFWGVIEIEGMGWLIMIAPCTPRVATESGDLLLVKFGKRYVGFQFDNGLAYIALGKSGTDREFNVFH
jgi:hypothetical protein